MIKLFFKQWLTEVGMGGGGPGSGMEPPKQDPTKIAQGAFADYHGPKDVQTDPANPHGQLPPTRRRMKKKSSKK